jgi:predicted Zn-dependent protease
LSNLRAGALQQAAMAMRMQQFARAEQIAADILKSSRTDRDAALILAHALIAQNRAAEAISPLERVLRRGGDAEMETLLGAAMCGAGRAADGIAQLRRTAAQRPPFLPAFQELAGQLAKAGQIDEAIATIEGGRVLVPENIDLQVDLGRLYLQKFEPAKARAALAAAREAAPGRADIISEFARALQLDGDHAGAADAFRHVLALNPDDALARANLASCLLELGQRDGGEAALRAVLRGKPHLLGRVAYVMAAASHGRFFFRPSTAAKFFGEQ